MVISQVGYFIDFYLKKYHTFCDNCYASFWQKMEKIIKWILLVFGVYNEWYFSFQAIIN